MQQAAELASPKPSKDADNNLVEKNRSEPLHHESPPARGGHIPSIRRIIAICPA
jgi:hypothetical protein